MLPNFCVHIQFHEYIGSEYILWQSRVTLNSVFTVVYNYVLIFRSIYFSEERRVKQKRVNRNFSSPVRNTVKRDGGYGLEVILEW
jgi:hypothetical protein